MTHATKIDRRKAIAVVAAIAATIGVGPALALAGDDIELRRLWAEYLAQLARLREATTVASAAREPYDRDPENHVGMDGKSTVGSGASTSSSGLGTP